MPAVLGGCATRKQPGVTLASVGNEDLFGQFYSFTVSSFDLRYSQRVF